MKQILIVGGGAAGLAAAVAASRQGPDARVTLLERMDRVGKKLLATGNGRCNLTNLRVSPQRFHSSDRAALEEAMKGMEPRLALSFFRSLGLLCQEEAEGRVYPYCRQASMVLDVFLQALEQEKIDVRCGCAVTEIDCGKDQFSVKTADGRRFSAHRVILACGGKAAPKLGSDGSGYALARMLGHSCTPLYPALTALKCDMKQFGGLKGIRAPAGLTLLAGSRVLGAAAGEVQFTEYGLSGIPVMELSGRLSDLKKGARCTALVDLFPQWQEDALLRELAARRQEGAHRTLETLLLGSVHKRLAYAALKSAGLQPLSRPIASLSEEELHRLARTLKGWPFSITGVQGWDSAQVTGGGIPLGEIDPKTMASRLRPGLYLAGELLDAAGDCGGFNLHWAWCSGIRAGQAAAGEVSP